MPIRLQPGFFAIHERAAKLTEMGDPLVLLNERIGHVQDFGLQQLNHFSDYRTEYQIRDRPSFM